MYAIGDSVSAWEWLSEYSGSFRFAGHTCKHGTHLEQIKIFTICQTEAENNVAESMPVEEQLLLFKASWVIAFPGNPGEVLGGHPAKPGSELRMFTQAGFCPTLADLASAARRRRPVSSGG